MKYEIGDLVRILPNHHRPGTSVGIVIAARHCPDNEPLYRNMYEVYLTNLKSCEFDEERLTKL